jgi:putative membrane protein
MTSQVPSGPPGPPDPAEPEIGATQARQLHPVSPLIHGARVAPATLLIGFFVGGNVSLPIFGRLATMVGLTIVAAIVVAAFQWIAWTKLTFYFDATGDFRLDSGVLQRNERRVQLSRLQSVDVAQPMIPRLFGMAEVRIEVAGDSNVNLAYLEEPTARALRGEILARAAGLHGDTEEAPERVLAQVAPGDLAGSLLLRGSTLSLLLATVFLITATIMFQGVGALGLVLITGGVPLFQVINQFNRFYNFTVAESPDGLRLRHGLLQTSSFTVPPGRVQAVGFSESWVWRRLGWVRVELNVAGSAGSDNETTGTVLLPVAPWPVATEIVARVLPGVDVGSLPLQEAPRRARWRAPVQWRCLAVGHDDNVLVARKGRFHRHHAVVPHARTQSVRITQGPWERSLRLASLHVDSTPGPVSITGLHLDAATARQIAEGQVDRADAARRRDGTNRWMQTSD